MAGFKLILFLSLCFAYAAAKDCSISLDDFEVEPVVLTSNDAGSSYDPFKPDGNITTIEEGTQILLVCAGKKNKFASVKGSQLVLTCKKGAFEDTEGKQHEMKKLQCTAIPTADLLVTEETCAEGKGVIMNAGFTYNENKFATIFSVCYDQATQKVFYTYNVINGKAIEFSIVESKRRSFKADGMGKTTTAVNKLYTTKHQIQAFADVYGKDQEFVTKKDYLARGHLTPDADGITRYEQLATYFYCNVKPEYQNINAGNWLRIESLARTAATVLQKDLHVYTGVLGTLEFPDKSGKMVKAYLDTDKQFEVPEYFFKVIIDPETDAGIVMISSNNPHLENVQAAQFCKTSVCDKANMIHENFPLTEKGFSFCCTVAEFTEHYDSLLPAHVSAKNLLTI